jgi:acetylornithine/succinyldiaminopimelate/putrescine aminotransferase
VFDHLRVYIQCEDRTVLDFYGGHAVAGLGYAHPAILDALNSQAHDLFFQSNAIALEIRATAGQKLVDFAPASLTKAFFVNSGSEANENALRLAIKHTGRAEIVALEHGFHGRTAGAGAVSWGSSKSWYVFPRTPFDVSFAPRDDAEKAIALITEKTAAVIIELVQGVAGAYDLDPVYVAAIADACKKTGTLLIVDEVQTGMGRMGTPFAADLYKVEPDLMTLAKSLGAGFPCGALLCSEAIANTTSIGDLGSTFGGGPLACRMIKTVIDVIQQDGLMDNVASLSQMLAESAPVGPVESVQGKGFLLGLRCSIPAKEVHQQLLEKNILTGTSADPQVVRLLPPYILNKQHIEQLLYALSEIG